MRYRLPSTRIPSQRRAGLTVLESAVVYPLVILLFFGLIVGSMGVFRFEETATLARAGARYASTHGYQYRVDAGQDPGAPGTQTKTADGWYWHQADPTSASGTDKSWTGDIYDNAIRPNLVGLDTTRLKVEVAWPTVINQSKADNWPGSRVTVRVTYTWIPELVFIGPFELSSTSTLPITN